MIDNTQAKMPEARQEAEKKETKVAVAKPETKKTQVSPKVRILTSAIDTVKSCKTIDEAVVALEKLLESKGTAGRAKINYDDITVKNASGEVTYVKCTVSGLWFPVSEFAKAKNEIGVTPIHKAVKNAKAKFLQEIKAARAALTDDFVADKIDGAKFKATLAAIDAKEFSVTDLKLEGGSKERPKV